MYYRHILLLYVYIRSTTIALFDQNMYVCVCVSVYINTRCESERPNTRDDRVRPSRGRGVGGWWRGGVEGGGVTSRRHSYAALEGAIRPWNAVDLFPARLHTHKHIHTHTHTLTLTPDPQRPGAWPGADYTILIHTHTHAGTRKHTNSNTNMSVCAP